ncbi:hypothetical protein [Streptomyces sp. CC210A]|uniref:WapI family immunity protein n=1 Tax=Streptomyces sp. CC210A TaxID=2898184 RepID=UPI001F2DD80A|nr:hypothetical protein [Streptomyces sp. CC210A]
MLFDDQGCGIGLEVLRYEFAAARGDAYDDNWLVVRGEVVTPTGRWSFTEPCLLTDEARRLSAWLREAAADGGAPAVLDFIEPTLTFRRVPEGVRVGLAHVGPGLPDAVDVRMGPAGLLRAADAWDAELVPFPAR